MAKELVVRSKFVLVIKFLVGPLRSTVVLRPGSMEIVESFLGMLFIEN
jgi:hypothetical protein